MADQSEEKIKREEKINKDIMIAELVSLYPETLDVLLESGLHCIGCYLSPYETLEQGTVGHGWDEEQLNDLIEKINETIKGGKNGLGEDKKDSGEEPEGKGK